MLIVYDRASGEIVGHCSRVFDSGRWREATMSELFPNADPEKWASLSVGVDARFVGYGAKAWRMKKDESGIVTGIERLPVLLVTCDAGDADNDDLPDLPADGKSSTVVTVRSSDGGDAEVTFRTTRGTLTHRNVQMRGGSATVELRAGTETVAVTVSAWASGYRPGQLDLEFVPLGAAPPAPVRKAGQTG